MASGKLLILIGEECKHQKKYHGLDKEYEFEVLFGVRSDTGDVLGLVESCQLPEFGEAELRRVAQRLEGAIELPYPRFSSKTLRGKPLHTWTLENRLDEIEIPTYRSTIHKFELLEYYDIPKDKLYEHVSAKIETIPPVTDTRKAIGNDFRRPDIRTAWRAWHEAHSEKSEVEPLTFSVARFRCICSSGTYMRTLAEVIARELNTCGLAYSIHRSKIGKYAKLPLLPGFWLKRY